MLAFLFIYLGNLIQVIHFGLMLFCPFAYCFKTKLLWITLVWIFGCLVLNPLMGGCPITMLSNQCFEIVSVETYSTATKWFHATF